MQINVVVGVCAAIDHVHHGHRQGHRCRAAKVTVKRQARLLGRRLGHSHRYGQHGVCPEAGFVLGAIQIDQHLVDEGLLAGIQAHKGLGDFGVDVLHSLQHALAQVAALVAIAQFNGLTRAGGCATGHRGAAHDTAFQQHIALDRGIATAIDHFTANQVNDCCHLDSFIRA